MPAKRLRGGRLAKPCVPRSSGDTGQCPKAWSCACSSSFSAVGPLSHVCCCCMVCSCEKTTQSGSDHTGLRDSTARQFMASLSFRHSLQENESCELPKEGRRCRACGHHEDKRFVASTHCGHVAAPRCGCVASLPASARMLRPCSAACICCVWSSVSRGMRLYVA